MADHPNWDDIIVGEVQLRALADAAPDIRAASWQVLRDALRSIVNDEVGKVAWDRDFLRGINREAGTFLGIADGVRQSTARVVFLLELERRLAEIAAVTPSNVAVLPLVDHLD